MAITSRGTINSRAKSASDATLIMTASALTVSVGNLAVIVIASDNSTTTDGDNGEVSTVTDSGGNTWTKVREHTNGQGAASAGATVSMWYTKATTALTAGAGTITVTFATQRLAKVMTGWAFTIGSSKIEVAGTTATSTDAVRLGTAHLSTALTSREYLFFRGDGMEGDILTYSSTAAYTPLIWERANGDAPAVGMILVAGEFKIATSTSAMSVAATNLNMDCASVFAAFYESAEAAIAVFGMCLTGMGR